MDQRDGVEFSGRERGIERRGIDVLAPIDLKRLGFLPAAAGDVEPFIGERAAHAAEDALADEIADGGFHHAPGGGGGKEDGLFGAKSSCRRGWMAR